MPARPTIQFSPALSRCKCEFKPSATTRRVRKSSARADQFTHDKRRSFHISNQAGWEMQKLCAFRPTFLRIVKNRVGPGAFPYANQERETGEAANRRVRHPPVSPECLPVPTNSPLATLETRDSLPNHANAASYRLPSACLWQCLAHRFVSHFFFFSLLERSIGLPRRLWNPQFHRLLPPYCRSWRGS